MHSFPGWHLVGQYESGVGSWLLHHGGEAVLLEVPEGLRIDDVRRALRVVKSRLTYATASHLHEDHLDEDLWHLLKRAFPLAEFIDPREVARERLLLIGGEPAWLLGVSKHSPFDVVTVFRGVAMTGDIELGMVESVNDEVPFSIRKQSMGQLAGFESRRNYRIHSTVSAHLDDFRTGVCWRKLFSSRGCHA